MTILWGSWIHLCLWSKEYLTTCIKCAFKTSQIELTKLLKSSTLESSKPHLNSLSSEFCLSLMTTKTFILASNSRWNFELQYCSTILPLQLTILQKFTVYQTNLFNTSRVHGCEFSKTAFILQSNPTVADTTCAYTHDPFKYRTVLEGYKESCAITWQIWYFRTLAMSKLGECQ